MTVDVPVRVPVLPETVSPLKPSEALRLGRLTRPIRIEGPAFEGEYGACAVGAITAGGLSYSRGGWGHELIGCPVVHGRWLFRWKCRGSWSGTLFGTVAHLNDNHHWSDDQIVAWLESVGL